MFAKHAILLLFVARVVAAPVSLRPPAGDGPSRVVRVCALPASQSRVAAVRVAGGRDGPVGTASPRTGLMHPAVDPASAAHRPLSSPDDYTRRSLGRLRC